MTPFPRVHTMIIPSQNRPARNRVRHTHSGVIPCDGTERAIQVFVHGAHGTKCYVLLRGLARVLHLHEDDESGVVYNRPYADLGPGDVSGTYML